MISIQSYRKASEKEIIDNIDLLSEDEYIFFNSDAVSKVSVKVSDYNGLGL